LNRELNAGSNTTLRATFPTFSGAKTSGETPQAKTFYKIPPKVIENSLYFLMG